MRVIDETGKRFSRLTVQSRVPGKGPARWLCLCDCGKLHEAYGTNLRAGGVKSCGCLREDTPAFDKVIHGHARKSGQRTPTYSSWTAMMTRCYNQEATGFDLWGGRGIRVFRPWHRFERFLKDMGPRPPGKSLDRINNDGNYTPKNCRWATAKEQSRNKSTTVFVEYLGVSRSLSEWSELLGIPYHSLHCRLRRMNWTVEKAMTTPHRKLKGRNRETSTGDQ